MTYASICGESLLVYTCGTLGPVLSALSIFEYAKIVDIWHEVEHSVAEIGPMENFEYFIVYSLYSCTHVRIKTHRVIHPSIEPRTNPNGEGGCFGFQLRLSDYSLYARSFPVQWFVEEIQNNPDLARGVVRKFIDENQDGELSAEELLRSVY